MGKICFQCNANKDIENFYFHPNMSDKRLNKCKECTRKDVKENRKKRITYYLEYDRKRHRIGYIKPCKIKKDKEYNYITWKGNKKDYRLLHRWIERKFGKPFLCWECKKDNLKARQYHWANKSGKYLKNKIDWIRLCASCHKRYDLNNFEGNSVIELQKAI